MPLCVSAAVAWRHVIVSTTLSSIKTISSLLLHHAFTVPTILSTSTIFGPILPRFHRFCHFNNPFPPISANPSLHFNKLLIFIMSAALSPFQLVLSTFQPSSHLVTLFFIMPAVSTDLSLFQQPFHHFNHNFILQPPFYRFNYLVGCHPFSLQPYPIVLNTCTCLPCLSPALRVAVWDVVVTKKKTVDRSPCTREEPSLHESLTNWIPPRGRGDCGNLFLKYSGSLKIKFVKRRYYFCRVDSRSTVAPPTFLSLTKSPVSKPAPGRIY